MIYFIEEQDLPDLKVHKDLPEHKEYKVSKAQPDLKDHKDHKEFKVRPDQPAQLDLKVKRQSL